VGTCKPRTHVNTHAHAHTVCKYAPTDAHGLPHTCTCAHKHTRTRTHGVGQRVVPPPPNTTECIRYLLAFTRPGCALGVPPPFFPLVIAWSLRTLLCPPPALPGDEVTDKVEADTEFITAYKAKVGEAYQAPLQPTLPSSSHPQASPMPAHAAARCRGAVVPWCRGAVVPWSRGAVVPWCRAHDSLMCVQLQQCVCHCHCEARFWQPSARFVRELQVVVLVPARLFPASPAIACEHTLFALRR
jgi:hypothetical protein